MLYITATPTEIVRLPFLNNPRLRKYSNLTNKDIFNILSREHNLPIAVTDLRRNIDDMWKHIKNKYWTGYNGGGGDLRCVRSGDKILVIAVTEKTLYMIDYLTREIPNYGDKLPIGEFAESCRDRGLMNSDGHGYYATNKKMTDIYAIPSDICQGYINKNFPYVVWFNK